MGPNCGGDIKADGGIKNVEVGFTLPPRGKAKPNLGKDRFSLGYVAMGLLLFNFVFDLEWLSATVLPSGEINVKIRVGIIGPRRQRARFYIASKR